MRTSLLKRLVVSAAFVCVTLVWIAALPAAEPPITSPAELWAGYDPTAEDLEIESIQTWDEDGRHFEKLRFTPETVDGAKPRVFAVLGLPAGEGSVPGVLHIHGGGQTASVDWVRFWTARGYACLTFDFCGPWANRTEVTDWGPIKHANMAHAAGGYQVVPTPRESSWFHWTKAARRALTLLGSRPHVDGDRLGIFGISMGGTLCWMVAGSDPRVKAAVPIYGCGYNLDRRKSRFGFGELTAEQQLFQQTMSSEAHAPYVGCPVLFLNASNDFHGWMDNAYDTLGALSTPHWQAVTPRHNHHIAGDQAANLPLWMDFCLRGGPAFPASPTIAVDLDDRGVPRTTLIRGADAIERVDFYYALSDKAPPSRFWRRAATTADDGGFRAELPVVDAWDELFAFANVKYTSGACLTTNLAHLVPAQHGKASATLAATSTIDPLVEADSWYFVTANTDPNTSRGFVQVDRETERGPAARLDPATFPGQASIYIGTHLVGDPQYLGPDGATLSLGVRGKFSGDGLTVTIKERDWTPLAKIYTAKIPAEKFADEWNAVELKLADFHTAEGASPANWRTVDVVQLQGTTNENQSFRVTGPRWVVPQPPESKTE